jgi:hypothetical protein
MNTNEYRYKHKRISEIFINWNYIGGQIFDNIKLVKHAIL